MARQEGVGDGLSRQGQQTAGGQTHMKRAAIALAFVLAAFAAPAQAMTIERIVSPSGIEAWLVRESTTPLVALAYSFHGGSSQDDADKSGAASLAANMLDEGAGELDSKAFHERLENHA